jgi:sortase (surface protein transpeptidase)
VKYPYTPDPGQSGNILIFGHTSYYWWKKNPYGDIFAKIPLLRHGDIIEIIWN